MGDFSFTSDKFIDYVVYDSTGTAMVSGSDTNRVIKNSDASIYFTYKPPTQGAEIVFEDEPWDVVQDDIFDLNNPGVNYLWGSTTAISQDGNVMAVSSDIATGDFITVYALSGDVWVEREHMSQSTTSGWFGLCLGNDGAGFHISGISGIKSYLWDGSNYNLTGSAAGTGYYMKSSMSADSAVFAYVGAIFNTGFMTFYDWDNTLFVLRGSSTPNFATGLSDVALNSDGTVWAVGLHQVNTSTGEVQVGTISGLARTTTDTLTASDGVAGDDFGYSVSMTLGADVIAVGAPGWFDPIEDGKVYIFRKILGVWTETEQIRSRTPGNSHRFGESVALSNDGKVVIGSPGASGDLAGQGKVDVFYYR